MRKFVKDPAAVLDYTWLWDDFLAAGETISSAVVVSDTDELKVATVTHDTTSVTAWLSEGEDEQRCYVTCTVTTSEGRTDERTIYVLVYDL